MTSFLAAQVVVQIIGLAVLRNEPTMGGMHVVLPSVTQATNVEPHSAILVFRKDKRIDVRHWQVFRLRPMPGYLYVKLDGERVRFIVNGTNALAKIPDELPHLENSCLPMRELSQGYQPPYQAAAAVVMIPKGFASACRITNGRIDTQVMMNYTGNYKVKSGNKSITLKNGAVVMIAHVPTAWVEGVETNFPPHLHSQVYFHMARQALDAKQMCTLQPPSGVPDCISSNPNTEIILQTTFECSNTQWP